MTTEDVKAGLVEADPGENILYIDRTGAETDDQCGMKYWLNRKAGGRGIVAVSQSVHLEIGRDTHEDLYEINKLDNIEPAEINNLICITTDSLTADQRLNQKEMEVLYRRLGWMAAYALYLEPREREAFERISAEKEIILDRTPLWTAITPDDVRRHRVDHYYKYREFKTVRWANAGWINHWQYDIQMHLGIKAIEEELGVKVAYGQVVGLMKGEYRDGKLSHPYAWAWRNQSSGAWTHDYNKARSAGWEPAPVWDYPGGVVAWVQFCGEEVALAQFPHSAPVFLNERMLENWVTAREARQEEIERVTDACRVDPELRLLYFPQRTRNCRPQVGDPCEYLAACWNAEINANPLASGLFKHRVPHHEIEVVLLDGAKEAPVK